MNKITVFNYMTIDGYFSGPNGETDWFNKVEKDEEWEAFTHDQARPGNPLIMGRKTYEMMRDYWTSPEAIKRDPDMAKAVNESPKYVFSKSMENAEEGPHWKNITLLPEINPGEIIRLKGKKDLTILGSGSIVQQFTNLGLIDEYVIVLIPVLLGRGKSQFEDVRKTELELEATKTFRNGLVLMRYERPENKKIEFERELETAEQTSSSS